MRLLAEAAAGYTESWCGCFADRCLYCADPQRSVGGPPICWAARCQALYHQDAPGVGPRPLAEASRLLCVRYPGLQQGSPEALARGALPLNESQAFLYLGWQPREEPGTGWLSREVVATAGPPDQAAADNDDDVDLAAAQLHAARPEAQAPVDEDDAFEVRMVSARH